MKRRFFCMCVELLFWWWDEWETFPYLFFRDMNGANYSITWIFSAKFREIWIISSSVEHNNSTRCISNVLTATKNFFLFSTRSFDFMLICVGTNEFLVNFFNDTLTLFQACVWHAWNAWIKSSCASNSGQTLWFYLTFCIV